MIISSFLLHFYILINCPFLSDLIGRGKAAGRNFLESSVELLKRDVDRQHVHHSRHPGTNYADVESHVSDVQLMLI